MRRHAKGMLVVLVTMASVLVFIGVSHADSVTVTTVRISLTNVNDAAGVWQYEGGQIYLDGAYVADYAATRRIITGGTDHQNTAMLTMTIFVIGSNPPENLTLQGSHDYSSGGYIGSVSAASSGFAFLIGASFEGNTSTHTLTITW
jgi:hypothetical protein